MERFIDKKIDGKQFETKFYELWIKDRDRTYSSKKLLDIAEYVDLTKFIGYSHIMSKLFIDCDYFVLDSALSEEELRNCVKKTVLKIKNGYP